MFELKTDNDKDSNPGGYGKKTEEMLEVSSMVLEELKMVKVSVQCLYIAATSKHGTKENKIKAADLLEATLDEVSELVDVIEGLGRQSSTKTALNALDMINKVQQELED